jgi:hypothetical protein
MIIKWKKIKHKQVLTICINDIIVYIKTLSITFYQFLRFVTFVNIILAIYSVYQAKHEQRTKD